MSVRWLVGWLVCLLVGRPVCHNFLQGQKVTLPCCCRRRKTVTDNSSRVVVVNQNNPSIFLFIYVFVYLSLHLYIYIHLCMYSSISASNDLALLVYSVQNPIYAK